MPIQVRCPRCGARASLPDSAAGRRARCQGCQVTFEIPACQEEEILIPDSRGSGAGEEEVFIPDQAAGQAGGVADDGSSREPLLPTVMLALMVLCTAAGVVLGGVAGALLGIGEDGRWGSLLGLILLMCGYVGAEWLGLLAVKREPASATRALLRGERGAGRRCLLVLGSSLCVFVLVLAFAVLSVACHLY